MLSICALIVVLVVGTLLPATVQAASILDEITDTETTEDFAEDTEYSLLRGSNLNFGSAKVLKLSNSEINLYGLTQCHHKCKKVYLSLYLEQKSNGGYSTYRYWEFDASNATSLEKSINVKVPKNHYYRLRGYHAAKDSGLKESISTLTSGIWIGN